MFISFIIFFEKKNFNLWFIKIYNFDSKNYTSFFKLIYNFLAKRWYINLIYNRYLASFSFFLGYNYTFILLDKGLFEAPTLLSVRAISSISEFLNQNFIDIFFLGNFYYIFFYL